MSTTERLKRMRRVFDRFVYDTITVLMPAVKINPLSHNSSAYCTIINYCIVYILYTGNETRVSILIESGRSSTIDEKSKILHKINVKM